MGTLISIHIASVVEFGTRIFNICLKILNGFQNTNRSVILRVGVYLSDSIDFALYMYSLILDNNLSTSKPTQKELDWISKRAGDNWRSLLTNLGLDLDVIMGYYNKYNGNTVNVCFEGLVFWVKGNTEEPVSYETLVKTLKDANLSSCATTLEEKQRTTLLRFIIICVLQFTWCIPGHMYTYPMILAS